MTTLDLITWRKHFFSFETVIKVKSVMVEFVSTIEGSNGALSVTIFFIHLQLHSKNIKSIYGPH